MPLPPSRSHRSLSNLAPLFRGSATLGLFLCLMNAATISQADGNVFRVNLGSFSGDDQLAPAVAETLLTDLAKSGRISVMTGPTGRSSDQEEGAYVLTGSCLVYDGSVVINVRIVDAATGRTLPGAAENVDGPKAQVFTLVHSLAGKLTARVTGDTTPSAPAIPARKPASAVPSIKPGFGLPSLPHVNANVNLGGGSRSGIPPVRTRPPIVARPAPPESNVPEVGVRVDSGDPSDQRDPRDSVMAEGQTESRDRRAPATRDDSLDASDRANRSERADRSDRSDRSDRGGPDENPLIRDPRSGHDGRDIRGEGARYTSLIIDARGLDLDRSMSPSIRRRDGTVVWNGGEADPDYVISDGIVAYAMTMREARDQARAGSRPLIIEAVSRHETPFPSDPYIDDEDADYILKAARHDGFLKKFHVIFVIGR